MIIGFFFISTKYLINVFFAISGQKMIWYNSIIVDLDFRVSRFKS